MAVSSIGPYSFISMSRMPSAPRQRLATETRAGVDGTAIWRLGIGGEPFSVSTVVDAGGFSQAQAMFQLYEALQGNGPYSVVYGGIASSFLVAVLDVSPVEVGAIVLGVGGTLGTSSGIVRAQWQLLPWRV